MIQVNRVIVRHPIRVLRQVLERDSPLYAPSWSACLQSQELSGSERRKRAKIEGETRQQNSIKYRPRPRVPGNGIFKCLRKHRLPGPTLRRDVNCKKTS